MDKMRNPTHFGSVFSRDIYSGNSNVSGYLYSIKDNPFFLPIDKLPKELLERIHNQLTTLEKEIGFVAEIQIALDLDSGKYKTLIEKRAKVPTHLYPKLVISLLEEGIVSEKQVYSDIPLDYVKDWFAKRVKKVSPGTKVICKSDAVGQGACMGYLCRDRESVERRLDQKEPVIWIIKNISTDDFGIISKVNGLVLTKAGPTSHATVIAKGIGIPFLIGCAQSLVDFNGKDMVTLDATAGKLYDSVLPLNSVMSDESLEKLITMAGKHCKIKVSANVDNYKEARRANNYGAKGIGLCRTEHMFLGKERTCAIRKLLFNDDISDKVFNELEEIQTEDYYKLFREEQDEFVVVRFLDAPLSEFLPKNRNEREQLAEDLDVNVDELDLQLNRFVEVNSMLGYRAARMLLTQPNITALQARAVFQAMERMKKEGRNIEVGIQIPLVCGEMEVELFKGIIERERKDLEITKDSINYKLGAMIETPRAGMLIDRIAPMVDFISFGTNDLTQMIFGLSRDDVKDFIDYYIEKHVIPSNPFVKLDLEVVGEFMRTVAEKAKKANPDIFVEICGEQAGDPESIQFLLNLPIDAISCSPSRIPLALLACAKYSVLSS